MCFGTVKIYVISFPFLWICLETGRTGKHRCFWIWFFIIMGNGHSKRTSLIFPRNSVKGTHARKTDLTQKPRLCELSLDAENSGHIGTQEENQSSDEDFGEIFYRFVILHAEDDEEEAVRVQELLQNEFCIKPGIIFAEMPSGRHQLENFQKAISGSAWTIILLTENFLSELWCTFQSYTSLYNALTTPHKCNTVIPMRPRNNPLPWEKTPFLLQSIKALQEDSPGFAEQVKRTFQESRYKQQQEAWRNQKKQVAQELLCWWRYKDRSRDNEDTLFERWVQETPALKEELGWAFTLISVR